MDVRGFRLSLRADDHIYRARWHGRICDADFTRLHFVWRVDRSLSRNVAGTFHFSATIYIDNLRRRNGSVAVVAAEKPDRTQTMARHRDFGAVSRLLFGPAAGAWSGNSPGN